MESNFYESQDFYYHWTIDDMIFCVAPNPDDEIDMIEILKLYFIKVDALSSK
ncbi:hypothetical protein ACFSTH_13060 [Paenibacillus yanchengensis]